MRVTQEELLADLSELCASEESREKGWLGRLSDEQRRQIYKLRKDFNAGKFKLTLHQVYKVVREQGYSVARTTFYDWVRNFKEEPSMAKSSGGKGSGGKGSGGKGGKGGKGC